jgi:hypothetical protein
VYQHPLGAWQAKNWDDEVGSKGFDKFCAALDRPPFGGPGDDDDNDDDDDGDNPSFGVERWQLDQERGLEAVIGQLSVPLTVINYAKYIRKVRTESRVVYIDAHVFQPAYRVSV